MDDDDDMDFSYSVRNKSALIYADLQNKIDNLHSYAYIERRIEGAERIRKELKALNVEQQVILLGEILKNVYGEDLALQATLVASETAEFGENKTELEEIFNTVDRSDLQSLAFIQAKIDYLSIEIAKQKLANELLKNEQEQEFYKSQEIDNQRVKREELNTQIKQFIQDNCDFSTELSRRELAEIRVSKLTNSPLLPEISDRVAQIDWISDVIAQRAFINLEPAVEGYLCSQDALIELPPIPNVPFKIGASKNEIVGNQVALYLYAFGPGKTGTLKIWYPLSIE